MFFEIYVLCLTDLLIILGELYSVSNIQRQSSITFQTLKIVVENLVKTWKLSSEIDWIKFFFQAFHLIFLKFLSL